MDYILNDIVDYDNGVAKGRGKVKGIAQNAYPVIGRTFILEDVSGNFPNETYPFTHFACFECQMKPIDDPLGKS